jgi:hypothetical protein
VSSVLNWIKRAKAILKKPPLTSAERQRRHYWSDPVEQRAQVKAYREKNKDKMKEYASTKFKRLKSDPQLLSERNEQRRAWRYKNNERINARKRELYAEKKGIEK